MHKGRAAAKVAQAAQDTADGIAEVKVSLEMLAEQSAAMAKDIAEVKAVVAKFKTAELTPQSKTGK